MSRLERSEYSVSKDLEWENGPDGEIKFISKQWKLRQIAVEQDIRDLRKRVAALERDGFDTFVKRVSNVSMTHSFTTSTEHGLSVFRTCAHLIRSKKAALLQCI